VIAASAIAAAAAEGVAEAAVTLRADVRSALEAALITEPSERARRVLQQLLDNARIAEAERVPVCQDTGTVWVWVELGENECIEGDLQREVDAAVAKVYRANGLRMSLVRDALTDRTNTGDNTPVFIDLSLRPGAGATVYVMLKGGGSDNASAVMMLEPAAGAVGVADAVIRLVEAKASAACPPLIVGVGVGGTFDTVAKLAKKALLVPLDAPSAEGAASELERTLFERVNATGIGPAGLGGRTTALGVRVLTAPCHIAALPVAVNLGCCAVRTARRELA
jgi:tartrate/fumarate subfamily iron-sulfur-dependent hydro-lyase alpha chain